MERFIIERNVKEEVSKWSDLQNKRGVIFKFTPKALEFIYNVIENIQEDPSDRWYLEKENINVNQKYAISLIPNALNEAHRFWDWRYIRKGNDFITISTWELWGPFSDVLKTFCFIPPKDM